MTAASPNNPVDFADLLAFYASVGVDEALEDAPVNRFSEAAPKPAERMPTTTPRESSAPEPPVAPPRLDGRAVPDAPAPRPPTSAVPDEAQAALARQLATAAVSL
ncbi:MAG: uracil-DNA glycosylase, partial [Mesorhizobium sp.]